MPRLNCCGLRIPFSSHPTGDNSSGSSHGRGSVEQPSEHGVRRPGEPPLIHAGRHRHRFNGPGASGNEGRSRSPGARPAVNETAGPSGTAGAPAPSVHKAPSRPSSHATGHDPSASLPAAGSASVHDELPGEQGSAVSGHSSPRSVATRESASSRAMGSGTPGSRATAERTPSLRSDPSPGGGTSASLRSTGSVTASSPGRQGSTASIATGESAGSGPMDSESVAGSGETGERTPPLSADPSRPSTSDSAGAGESASLRSTRSASAPPPGAHGAMPPVDSSSGSTSTFQTADTHPEGSGTAAGPGGRAAPTRLLDLPPELLQEVVRHLSAEDRIAFSEASPRSVQPIIRDQLDAAEVMMRASRLNAYDAFVPFLQNVWSLPLSVQGETLEAIQARLAALGAQIPRLPDNAHAMAIDRFLQAAESMPEPLLALLDELIHAAQNGLPGLLGRENRAHQYAMEALRNGASLETVMNRYAITHPGHLPSVYLRAASMAIWRGATVPDAAREFGITGEVQIADLERIATLGPARTAVRGGAPVDEIIARFGIKGEEAMSALEYASVIGPAGAALSAGASAAHAANQYGIRGEAALRELNRLEAMRSASSS